VDFALWKKAEPNHIMQWPSPWGQGYPGWHLECSVMSMKYLGATIDIHGGGLENQFPHHECEIAQSESANGMQFVRYWLHNNMVTVDGQKMGKSLNNFITLKQAFSGAHERLTRSYDPLAIRQLILNSHYRSPLDFSDAALFAALSGQNKIADAVKAVRKRLKTAPEGQIDSETAEQLRQLKDRFKTAMNDDLNTSVALSVIFELVRLTNKMIETEQINTSAQRTRDTFTDLLEVTRKVGEGVNKGTLAEIDKLFRELGGDVLGIVRDEYPEIIEVSENRFNELVDFTVKLRDQERKKRNFEVADATRAELNKLGIELLDKPDGTEWRIRETEPMGE
jgi:cysteinyl-tRNA synthetase